MRVLAIDPGTARSAFVVYDSGAGEILAKGIADNAEVLWNLKTPEDSIFHPTHLAIEMVASYGMAVGAEVFRTVYWIGRFVEAWGEDATVTEVYRKDVKMNLCGQPRAKDANIRQALIDRFGGASAIGKKATPGPLFGVSSDIWSALAVAVTFADKVPTIEAALSGAKEK